MTPFETVVDIMVHHDNYVRPIHGRAKGMWAVDDYVVGDLKVSVEDEGTTIIIRTSELEVVRHNDVIKFRRGKPEQLDWLAANLEPHAPDTDTWKPGDDDVKGMEW